MSRAYLHLGRLYATRRDSLLAALVSSTFIMIVVTALGSLWLTAAGGKILHGYSAAMLVWYVAVAEVAVTSVASNFLMTASERIRSGEVSSLMTRPVRPDIWLVAEEVGSAVARSWMLLPAAGLVAFLLVGPPPDPLRLVSVVLTLPLAISLQVCVNVALAGSTFWLGDSRAVYFLHQKVVFLVGGMLIPAELVPEPFATVFPYLPWAGMAYAPARGAVAAGPAELAQIVLLQLLWLCAAVLLMRLTFVRGQQRMAVGGG